MWLYQKNVAHVTLFKKVALIDQVAVASDKLTAVVG